MPDPMLAAWPLCLERLEAELPAEDFHTWIKPLQALPQGEGLALFAPNAFVVDTVRERHLDRIVELLRHFSNHASWMEKFRTGKIINNSTYDQTAVLYAVRNGTGKYWDKISNGYCKPDAKGGNQWIVGAPSNHSYLKLTVDNKVMETLIESIMLNDF